MKKIVTILSVVFIILMNQSCIVSGPKFANVDKVMELKPGMTFEQVNTHLGIGPYDLHEFDSIGRRSYVYKYRVMDRKTVPFLLKETNGIKSRGKIGRAHV